MNHPALTLAVRVGVLLVACAGLSKGAPVPTTVPAVPNLAVQTARDFARGTAQGVVVDPAGIVKLTPGGPRVGTLESAPITAPAAFTELLPSWNAVTPVGTSITVEVRADLGGRWTKYYSFGRWATGDAKAAGRASVNGQKDADGDVLTDVVRLARPATRYQYRVRLHGAAPDVSPTLRRVTFTTSGATRAAAVPANRAAWGKVLNVPARSQMIYPNGGDVWCSPTSVSMVLAYWGVNVTVPDAARDVFDPGWDGTGNWAFNVAYAATHGLTAHVTRLGSLAQVEQHILAGIPVVISVGWNRGELPGAPLPSVAGHLMVVVGFDARGNVVVNDPAGKTDAEVRRTYDRATLERLWQTRSSGTVYLIHPS